MPKISSQLITVRLAGLGAVAIGTYIPIARTTGTLTYSIVGNPAWMIGFMLAISSLLLIFANDIPASISKKTNWISFSLLVVICVYTIIQFMDGLHFFLFQSAGDMAGNQHVNKDQYWGTLYALSGITDGSHQLFGLKSLYEQIGGPYTQFWEVIYGLSNNDARKLTALPGGRYFVLPTGISLIFLGTYAYSFPERLARLIKSRFPTVFPDWQFLGSVLDVKRFYRNY